MLGPKSLPANSNSYLLLLLLFLLGAGLAGAQTPVGAGAKSAAEARQAESVSSPDTEEVTAISLDVAPAVGSADSPAAETGLTDAKVEPPKAEATPTPAPPASPTPDATPSCNNTVTANVVAFDIPITYNRLGVVSPGGMMFALMQDVKPGSKQGNVNLRDGKRPRPIVLRVNAEDCLLIKFTNWLASAPKASTQPSTRTASVHIEGMQLLPAPSPTPSGIMSDGSFVGQNDSSLVSPGGTATYLLRAPDEGTFLLYSQAASFGNGLNGGQVTSGLFGAVNVEPKGSEWYRSQVTRQDLALATKGRTATNQPIINYDATYPSGLPVLKMVDATGTIVHSDLTAVITGKGHGRFTPAPGDPNFNDNPALPDRRQPFREITIIYHEELGQLTQSPFVTSQPSSIQGTINSGMDNFAINYGTGGIAAEVISNRLKQGPTANCAECKFEEFFLSSWAVGDPAMVVGTTATGNKPVATYADDPSNVYHSYLSDHVRYRVLHGGTGVTHVHHMHAQQWLHSPNSDTSAYLDSQTINPGAAYTMEMVYNGSGNRNKTIGDSIFHCHFYPHFAQGMWALWRVHDTFEEGTELDGTTGLPKPGARALPDGQIAEGTPIPAVVPLPTIPMAPMPARVQIVAVKDPVSGKAVGFSAEVLESGNPGYPFFIPGVSGHRAPHPPMDFAYDLNPDGTRNYYDGGLPRHIILNAQVTSEAHTATDFTKEMGAITAKQLAEDGEPVERTAMEFHALHRHPSFTSDGSNTLWNGQPADFLTNGLPPAQGAPYADPGCLVDQLKGDCAEKDGKVVPLPPTEMRRYKAANVQTNLVFNKKGWHYPQGRTLVLWQDVLPTINGTRAPQPFFFRANSGEAVEFWHTNLIPDYYELDDFQVRTPTDIIGQHIHLVKFDVTSSDGAANGFNYEDGTLSPDDVRKRIEAITSPQGHWLPSSVGGVTADKLVPKPPSTLICPAGSTCPAEWMGAQTTIQRWLADTLFSVESKDRTMGTVFTHDHFGPSTHQQVGLYAGLLIEPSGSKWFDAETNAPYPDPLRKDGGPTSWQAIIRMPAQADSFREFALEFQDFQLAYMKTSKVQPDCYPGQSPAVAGCKPVASGTTYMGWADPNNAIIAPTRNCTTKPCPQLISNGPTPGVQSVNYRNEPLPFRLFDPTTGKQAAGPQGDPSFALASIPRLDTDLNKQPALPAPINPAAPDGFKFPALLQGTGLIPVVSPTDPFTPLVRAYQGDNVQVRVLVGAHMLAHSFSIHGMKWLFEPGFLNSGYRGTQGMGISEHFEFKFKLPLTKRAAPALQFVDYLYTPSDLLMSPSTVGGTANGQQLNMWGVMRAYDPASPPKLLPRLGPQQGDGVSSDDQAFSSSCPDPSLAPVRSFEVTVMSATSVFDSKLGIVYNSRGKPATPATPTTPATPATGPIYNPLGLVYVVTKDNGTPVQITCDPSAPLGCNEPLVLRANAGDCIKVTLTNGLTGSEPIFTSANATQLSVFNQGGATTPSFSINPSMQVGLHPQVLTYDPTTSDGIVVGQNPDQTVGPGKSKTYTWYAGNSRVTAGGLAAEPIEFGSINLTSSDLLLHGPNGLIGALIIEPRGSIWMTDKNSRASATVCQPDAGGINCAAAGPTFREFVLLTQDNANQYTGPATAKTVLSTSGSLNYRTEPMLNARYAGTTLGGIDLTQSVSNSLPYGFASGTEPIGRPQTPIFTATLGDPVRFRMLRPSGSNQQVMMIHGHVWQELPFMNNSRELGFNEFSQSQGARDVHGPSDRFDLLIPRAGGVGTAGDYLYRSFPSFQFTGGLWGIFTVTPASADRVTTIPVTPSAATTAEVLAASPAAMRASRLPVAPPVAMDSVKATVARKTRKGAKTELTVKGYDTVNPKSGSYTKKVIIYAATNIAGQRRRGDRLGEGEVNQLSGEWSVIIPDVAAGLKDIVIESEEGGTLFVSVPFPLAPLRATPQAARRPSSERPTGPQGEDESLKFIRHPDNKP
ncbi:MAG: manganese oxidase [Acidobacteriota bacterium]|jgi:hypothetical protein|nr:manganese oxidase [Acidobacteriota bacterium]